MERVINFFFLNTGVRQTLTKNAIWLIVGEVFSRVLRFLIVIYAVRNLGTAGWGIFSYALGIGGILMLFSDIGLSGYLTREIAQKKENLKQIVSTALFIKFCLLIISSLLIVCFGPYISKVKEASSLLSFIALILFFDSLRELGLAINRAYEKMEWDAFVKITTSLILLVVGFFLLKQDMSPGTLAIIYLISSFGGCIIVFFVLTKKIVLKDWKLDRQLVKTIFATTLPFAFTGLLGVIMTNTDIYMLGIWREVSDIGIYSAGQRLYQFILFIPGILSTATFPILSKLSYTEPERFKDILQKILSLAFWISLPIAFGGVILAKEIVGMTLGTIYIKTIPVFQILMIMTIVSFPSVIISNAIFAQNEQKFFLKSTGIGALLNILLNMLLIPHWGFIGAAFSTLVAITISTTLMWLKIRKLCYLSLTNKLGKIFVSVIVMASACLLLKLIGVYFIINIIVSALIYIVLLYLLRDQNIHDFIDLLKSNLQKTK